MSVPFAERMRGMLEIMHFEAELAVAERKRIQDLQDEFDDGSSEAVRAFSLARLSMVVSKYDSIREKIETIVSLLEDPYSNVDEAKLLFHIN